MKREVKKGVLLNLQLPEDLNTLIAKITQGFYLSKSEFFREAIRVRIEDYIKNYPWLANEIKKEVKS